MVGDASGLDFGEVVARWVAPTDEKEGDGGGEDVENSEEITGKIFDVHLHNFDGSDDIKWECKDEFAGAGESAKQKGIGAGFDGFGVMV